VKNSQDFSKILIYILLHNCYRYGNDQIDPTSSNIIQKNQKNKNKTTNVENKTFA
jgi:hypothetical protein